MCGINGYYQFKKELTPKQIKTILNTMNNSIIHRGPDDEGLFFNQDIGLGMRRLSVIDLETGNQPLFNEDKTLVLVCNGEIYNYLSLKQRLISKGYKFQTKTDTEVIIYCFEEYGTDSFNMLNGMFSFALYDINKNLLYLVRDRAGEKPLYYYQNGKYFTFASELKSMINSDLIEKKICKKALNQYLQLTYIPAPLSIFENVYKLLPGYYLCVGPDGEITSTQYWNLSYHEQEQIQNYNECKKFLRETLFKSVEECMVSDVPKGSFLSGGIDSAIITGIMTKISKEPVNTFTITFKEKGYDESKRARASASLHQTNHREFCLTYDEALPYLDMITGNIDEPFADSSLIPTYLVSKLAKEYVTVILTGDAGDELFGGYNKYMIDYYSKQYRRIPKWLRENVIRKYIYALPDNTGFTRKTRKVIENSEKDRFNQRLSLMCLGFKNDEIKCLLKDEHKVNDSLGFIKDYYDQIKSEDEITKAFYTDFKIVLEGDMLPKVDRACMLNSLETRTPLLHKDVIECSSKIPSQFKIARNKTKIILKDTFQDLIPKSNYKAKKMGFAVPIASWMRNELKNEICITLNKEYIEKQNIFHYQYIKHLLDEHFTLKKDRSSELWALYIFQKWYMNYYD